jgi:phospholipid/cholesterol/gamma-HCH transport system permease protein
MPADTGNLEAVLRDGVYVVTASGQWTLKSASKLESRLATLVPSRNVAASVDFSNLQAIDTAGALLVRRLYSQLEQAGNATRTMGLSDSHAALIDRVAAASQAEPLPPDTYQPLIAMVERTGRAACAALEEAADLLYFLGVTSVAAVRSLIQPGRIRFVSVLSHIEHVGLNAIPIVGLLSFLIGIVVAYQGADQLRRFGAEIFTIDLLGVSIFREMGILLAAIVIAGRSGSAFAAQIGTMQVNQEVDAMKTLGLDPVEILVLPRIMALIISMPLIAVFADIMGLLGGGLMVILALDVSIYQFLERLQGAVTVWTYWAGVIKAPVFGFLIALTGCREGLKVRGSAESVGLHTTRAVVISIFLVILADALFSILFSAFGI